MPCAADRMYYESEDALDILDRTAADSTSAERILDVVVKFKHMMVAKQNAGADIETAVGVQSNPPMQSSIHG